MTFFRVCSKDDLGGPWYAGDGTERGLVRTSFRKCKIAPLPMPFDSDHVGWLSAVDSIEMLRLWFPEEDLRIMREHGYAIHIYEARKWRRHPAAHHPLICSETSRVVGVVDPETLLTREVVV